MRTLGPWLCMAVATLGCADGASSASDGMAADAESVDVGEGASVDPDDAGPVGVADLGQGRDADPGDLGLDAGLADQGTAIDVCGGPCPNGRVCGVPADCASGRCVEGQCVSPEGTHPDIVQVIEVPGRNPGGLAWADSYSVLDKCYCRSTFDHGIGTIVVDTPVGARTVRDVCAALGPGPGIGAEDDRRPVYNDIQCGNGPPNDAGDEDDCPGRVDIGRPGCGHIGPRWDLSGLD